MAASPQTPSPSSVPCASVPLFSLLTMTSDIGLGPPYSSVTSSQLDDFCKDSISKPGPFRRSLDWGRGEMFWGRDSTPRGHVVSVVAGPFAGIAVGPLPRQPSCGETHVINVIVTVLQVEKSRLGALLVLASPGARTV